MKTTKVTKPDFTKRDTDGFVIAHDLVTNYLVTQMF